MKNIILAFLEFIGYSLIYSVILLIFYTGWMFFIAFAIGFFNIQLEELILLNYVFNVIIDGIIIIIGIIIGLIIAKGNYKARCEIDSVYEELTKNPEDVDALLTKAYALSEIFVFGHKPKREAKSIYLHVLNLEPNNYDAKEGLEEVNKKLKE